jgi:hypothetical protein
VEGFLRQNGINVLVENGGVWSFIHLFSEKGGRGLNVRLTAVILAGDYPVVPDEAKATFYAAAELAVRNPPLEETSNEITTMNLRESWYRSSCTPH